MSKVLNNVMCSVEQVTFDEFLKAVRRYESEHLLYQYSQLESLSEPEDMQEYTRQFTMLKEGSEHKFVMDLVDRLEFLYPGKTSVDITSTVEEAMTTSIQNLGQPTHLVRLSERTYLLACAEDYVLAELSGDPAKAALVCYAPHRNFLLR